MSLLPRALQFRDEALRLPLGAAKVKPVAVKVDLISAFERGDHNQVLDPTVPFFGFDLIDEADCRKGAAKPASREVAPIGRPADAAPPSTEKPPKFKDGDRVRAIRRFNCWYDAGDTGVVLNANALMVRFDPSPTTEKHLIEDGTCCNQEDLEPLPSEPKEADGWIEHDGGPCPVPAETIVVCRTRGSGEYSDPSRADTYPANLWETNPQIPNWPGDIVAYRLVKQQ